MNIQEQQNAINGQGSGNINLEARRLKSKNAKTPNQISLTRENPYLYMQLQSPEAIQASRVIVQVMNSANPRIALSSQLNNRLNPTMENHLIKGGNRKSI